MEAQESSRDHLAYWWSKIIIIIIIIMIIIIINNNNLRLDALKRVRRTA